MRTPGMMAALLAAALATPTTARAHFLWLQIEPGSSPPVARVYFSETPEPGEPALIDRIEGTAMRADGRPLDVVRRPDHLEARLPMPLPAQVEASRDFGVITRQEVPFLLLYTARAQTRPTRDDPSTDHPRLDLIAVDGGKATVRASWKGKPLAATAVRVLAADAEPSEVTTDSGGLASIPGVAEGKAALLLRVVEPQPGERDGRSYSEVRHYASLMVSPAPAGAASTSPELSADDVLRKAHEARACWGPGFPGFTADLAVHVDDQVVRGTVDVSPEGEVALDLPAGAARDWARVELRSLVMHRGLDGPSEFDPGATFAEPESGHPLGRAIRLSDDRMGSIYRIRGDEIREVNRTMGASRFSNRILANTRNAEGKLLPSTFTVTYWDTATGGLQKSETFHDTWVRVGRLDLPRTHTQIVAADKESPVRQIELSHHKLKEGSAGETRAAAPAP